MLIMRMYALYERSLKVLALYIVVAVAILVVGCVSLHFSGKQLIFYCSYSGLYWMEKKKNLGTWMCKDTSSAAPQISSREK
jgi:hypothetical protein